MHGSRAIYVQFGGSDKAPNSTARALPALVSPQNSGAAD